MDQLTGIVVDLGKNDVQHLSFLDLGQLSWNWL